MAGPGTGITYARVFTDGAGRSRIEDQRILLDQELTAPPAEPLKIASLVQAFGSPSDVMLVRGDSSWAGEEPHPAPSRLLWAILAGEWEVTVDGGKTRGFRGGDLVLFEDTAGRGHSSRILADDSLALVMRLA